MLLRSAISKDLMFLEEFSINGFQKETRGNKPYWT